MCWENLAHTQVKVVEHLIVHTVVPEQYRKRHQWLYWDKIYKIYYWVVIKYFILVIANSFHISKFVAQIVSWYHDADSTNPISIHVNLLWTVIRLCHEAVLSPQDLEELFKFNMKINDSHYIPFDAIVL